MLPLCCAAIAHWGRGCFATASSQPYDHSPHLQVFIHPTKHSSVFKPPIYCHDTIQAQIFIALSSLVAFLAASPVLLPKAASCCFYRIWLPRMSEIDPLQNEKIRLPLFNSGSTIRKQLLWVFSSPKEFNFNSHEREGRPEWTAFCCRFVCGRFCGHLRGHLFMLHGVN